MNLSINVSSNIIKLNSIRITSDLQRQICEAQDFDEHLQERKRLLEQGNGENIRIEIDRVMKFNDRICVPNDPKIKKKILDKVHKSKSIYLFIIYKNRAPHYYAVMLAKMEEGEHFPFVSITISQNPIPVHFNSILLTSKFFPCSRTSAMAIKERYTTCNHKPNPTRSSTNFCMVMEMPQSST